jgi:hypothetical protein
VLGLCRERLCEITRAAQARSEGLQAPHRPASRRLVLRAVLEAVAPAASVGATKEHSAGPATSRALKPPPTAAKACPRVGEVHDLSCVLPRLSDYAMAVDEVHTIVPSQDADRAAGPLD